MSKDSTEEKIDQIHQILRDAPALNGGFNNLVNNVDSLINTSEKLSKDMTSIKEAIYDPGDGLFSRIKNNDNKIKRLEEIEEACPYKEDLDKYNDLLLRIDRLEMFKGAVIKSLYIVVPWILTISGKLSYDLVVFVIKNSIAS